MLSKIVVYDSIKTRTRSENEKSEIFFDELFESNFFVGKYLEDKIEDVIHDVLAWTHDIGKSTIRGQTLEDFMRVPGLSISAWWISMIPEKCILEHDAYWELMKTRALEYYLNEIKPSQLIYKGSKNFLGIALRGWSASNQCHFTWTESTSNRPKSTRNVLTLSLALLHSISAPFEECLRVTGFFPSTAFLKRIKNRKNNKTVALISYANSSDIQVTDGRGVDSKYWGRLPDLLRDHGYCITWIWFNTDLSRNGRKSLTELQLTANKTTNDTVYLIENALDLKMTFSSLIIFFRILFLRKRLIDDPDLKESFMLKHSHFNFFSLFDQGWLAELITPRGMRNIVRALCFDRLFGQTGKIDFGLYLYEGQNWERTLVRGWKKNQKGKLFGVQHGYLRLCDLRQYQDGRSFQEKNHEHIVVPDFIICNGETSLELLKQYGVPSKSLKLAEALRYSYMSGRQNVMIKKNQDQQKTILVVGDWSLSRTISMLELLSRALDHLILPAGQKILIKPHPDCPSLEKTIDKFGLSPSCAMTDEPLSQLWSRVRVAFCPISATAMIESLWFGVPVVVIREPDRIYLCPLFGLSNKIFFNSVEDFIKKINFPMAIDIPSNVFCLDDNYPRWKTFISGIGKLQSIN